ncbi:MAG TPA: penicillin-binding transpeptidase domain-containing protein [Tissierellaceae bacterium]|nr:penicillin-binding transpeptidase domain-containing protein [Tissierellaceae bacterium]
MKKIRFLLILTISMTGLLFLNACSSEKPIDRFELYKTSWENKDYKAMYSMLSKESRDYISEEDFIKRYRNIYNGIEAKNIEIDINESNTKEETIKFNLKMDSLAGEISQNDYLVEMKKEKIDKKSQWFIKWNENLIFPQMEKGDEVKVSISKARRGEIYDRSGNGLAINGSRYSIGIQPSKYDESNTKDLARLLDIDEEVIDEKLDKNTNPEHFVPIVKLSTDEDNLVEELIEIEGIIYQKVDDRVYPGGESSGALVGYIKPITSEELKKDKDGIYSSNSLVGKFGLEEVYEEDLRAVDGKEIYISKKKTGEETEPIILAKTESKDGANLNTTIDIELQKEIYNEIDGDIGASTAIDPTNGEVLALVSSPTFDSNLYTTYISNSQKEDWDDMDVNVFENKFNKVYSPGSTFKLLTAAIGLEQKVIDPNEKINIEGKGWQKDSSWGNYKINRVNESKSSIDLNDAIVYSDNIYFAMTALDIGEDRFLEELKKFGFNEDLPIDYPMENSQIISEDSFDNEILLADTGYGQGQILMSPLHTSLVYSSIINDSKIMEPFLDKDKESKVWKENVMSDKNRDILLNSFINVIEDENGTGHKANLDNIKLAGKTGTAELKLTQEDTDQENGWFVAMNVDNPKIVISMLIEDVADKGGSQYPLTKVRNVLENYLKD